LAARISISELARRLASAHPPQLVEALSPILFADAHRPGTYNLPIANWECSVGVYMPFKGFKTPQQLPVGDVFVPATPAALASV
jgi:hypothetical protein